ncbi:MAG: efflux RND transporter periplasmic adaptor subunit [Candidatus Rifleibacteriota bacterium]
MKNKFKTGNSTFFLFLVVTTILLLPLSLRAQSEDGPEIPVFVTLVSNGTINQTIETSGDILPKLGVNIHPEASGRIVTIMVDVGSPVKKGQELVTVYNDVQKAQLQQAQAAVTVAKAAIEMQKVMVETSQSSLVAAKAGVLSAEAQLKNLAATRERLQNLFSEGAVSRQQLDDVIAQHDSASARLTAAQSEVKRAQDMISSAKMTLEMRRADLIQAEANLNSVQVLLDNTVVRAPFDGIITARLVDPGAMASPAAPVLRIEQINPVKIVGTLIEKDLFKVIAQETEAMIRVDSIKQEFRGRVEKIYPSIESSSRTGRIEILLDNPDHSLRSGMFAKISLLIQTSANVPIISRESLLRHDENFYALVIEKGKAVKRLVKTGIINEDKVEIIDGLKAGEQIIAKGLEFIREGSPVKIAEGENKP